ncbi:Programmed cell death toxin YdcE [Microcystis aeruginosa NIES-2549]|uniref:Programmed cell death toxin YdcE n=1 Tax=Microcystis aeruginosa NIES-2549 TaxID=1641812 RepID=A0A0F6U5F4_MICAE|nr:Programmed cell death toxin YdcE [Microcystis aeruginosa NIES-2549]AOC53852.1 Programmed cell death toxin YdcE [Microcystis aeruginosa NIES-2481]
MSYSVFQSAEVQKLWFLGKRQEAKVKREEKYVYLTSLGNAIYHNSNNKKAPPRRSAFSFRLGINH